MRWLGGTKVLSPAAAAARSLAHSRTDPYLRPTTQRSLAGDELNPVRTSHQCWCNFAGCFADPSVHTVVRRITDLTGTSFNTGEDLQVVRYSPGQFYKVRIYLRIHA